MAWPLAALMLLFIAAAASAWALQRACRDLAVEVQRLPALHDEIEALRAELGSRRATIGRRPHR